MSQSAHKGQAGTRRLLAVVVSAVFAGTLTSAPAVAAEATDTISGVIAVPDNVGPKDMCITAYGQYLDGYVRTFSAQVSADVYAEPVHPTVADHTAVTFSLPVAAGTYVLEVANCDYSKYWAMFADGEAGNATKDASDATGVAAGTSGLAMTLPDNRPAFGSVRGTLAVDGTGAPIVGSVVSVCPSSHRGRCIVTASDEFGAFRANNVPNGTWDVRISSGAAHKVLRTTAVISFGSSKNLGDLVFAPATADDLAEFASVSGAIIDLDGNLLEGATVTLLHSATPNGDYTAVADGDLGLAHNTASNPVLTNADGSFAFDPAPGFYKVRVAAEGCRETTFGSSDIVSEAREVPPLLMDMGFTLDCSVPPPPVISVAAPAPAPAPEIEIVVVESTPTAEDTEDDAFGAESVTPCPTVLTTFADVDANAVHNQSIGCLAALGVASGVSTDLYDGGTNVTRGQVASMVVRSLELLAVPLPEGEDRFSDDNGSVHEPAINKLANAGIVRGTSATEFSPSAHVTRAQMASIISALITHATGDATVAATDHFTDDNGTVHEAAINRAAGLGLVRGYDAETFGGNNNTTRAQLATLLLSVVEHLIAQSN